MKISNMSVVIFVVLGWLLAVMLCSAADGPFCPYCDVQVVGVYDASKFQQWRDGVDTALQRVADLQTNTSESRSKLSAIREQIGYALQTIAPLASTDFDMYSALLEQLQTMDQAVSEGLTALDEADNNLSSIASALSNLPQQVYLDHTMCVACNAESHLGESGGCTCKCPDYTQYIDEIEAWLGSIDNWQATIYDAFLTWQYYDFHPFVDAWRQQDTKLQQYCDAALASFPKMDRFFGDYYSSVFGVEDWNNWSGVLSLQKSWYEATSGSAPGFLKFYSSFNDSTWSSETWSKSKDNTDDLRFALEGSGNKEGRDGLAKLLYDYWLDGEYPWGDGNSSFEDADNLEKWKSLHWWTAVKVALGHIAYATNEVEEAKSDITTDKAKELGDNLKDSVTEGGTGFNGSLSELADVCNRLASGISGSFGLTGGLPTDLNVTPGFTLGEGIFNIHVEPIVWEFTDSVREILLTIRNVFRVIWGLAYFALLIQFYRLIRRAFVVCVNAVATLGRSVDVS